MPVFPDLNERGGTQRRMRGFADWSLRGILSNGTPAALDNQTTRHSREIVAGAGETLENVGAVGSKGARLADLAGMVILPHSWL